MNDETKQDETVAELKMKLALTEFAAAERTASDARYARRITETIVFGTIILFAIAALYFIFTKVGLPTPSIP